MSAGWKIGVAKQRGKRVSAGWKIGVAKQRGKRAALLRLVRLRLRQNLWHGLDMGGKWQKQRRGGKDGGDLEKKALTLNWETKRRNKVTE